MSDGEVEYWPDKDKREQFEIKGFIEAYRTLPQGRMFKVIAKQEKPDYIVEDESTGEKFGIELTSVYIDKKSVPDVHKKPHNGPVSIPYNIQEIENYKKRLLEKVKKKNDKALHYASDFPLILAIYTNEYCSIYMDELKEWEDFVRNNATDFNCITRFREVVFWNITEIGAFRYLSNI